MCFGNRNNQFGGIRVFLNFGVIYEGLEESKGEIEEREKVLNSTLADIEVFTLSLRRYDLGNVSVCDLDLKPFYI